MQLVRATWLLPIEAPPIPGGAVVFEGGILHALGDPARLATQWPITEQRDLDGCALLPALVNGHTHLELSGLPVPEFGDGFIPWLCGVIDAKRSVAPGAWRGAVEDGLHCCLRSGQGTIADVVSVPEAAAAYPLTRVGPRVLAFPEVIAPRPDNLALGLERARAVEASVGIDGTARVGGLAPHAPYTVSGDAYACCVDRARAEGWRWMTHLAESRDEVEFCIQGTGPVVESLYGRLPVVPPMAPGCHPVEWLAAHGWLGPGSVLVHGVHLEPRHVSTIASCGAGVVLCPRSNRNLCVGVADGRALLDAGIAVGLGTDSVLSAGDLNLCRELIAAVDDYGWSPQEAVIAATRGSARVLGLDREVGSLSPGRRADLVAVALGPGGDPWEALLTNPVVRAVWLGGEPAWLD